MANFDELPEVQNKSDLVDFVSTSEGSTEVNKLAPDVDGVEQLILDVVSPEIAESTDPLNHLEVYELWFDVDTGERVQEPEWFRENEKTFKKYAEKIGNKEFDDLYFDHIPDYLVRRTNNSDVDPSNPYTFLHDDGVVYEIVFEELVKSLMNVDKIKHAKFYLGTV